MGASGKIVEILHESGFLRKFSKMLYVNWHFSELSLLLMKIALEFSKNSLIFRGILSTINPVKFRWKMASLYHNQFEKEQLGERWLHHG